MKTFVTKNRWILPDEDLMEADKELLFSTLEKYDIDEFSLGEDDGPVRAWEIYSLMEKGKAWESVGPYSPEEVLDILKRYGVIFNEED